MNSIVPAGVSGASKAPNLIWRRRAAQDYDLSERFFDKLIERGVLTRIKVGRKTYLDRDELARYFEKARGDARGTVRNRLVSERGER